MESGQYVYSDERGKQHQGIMGRRETYEDKWRENDVWLLIDGKVNDTFLYKTTKACVFSSPEKKNFHTLLKSSNAMRIVLSPWRKDELKAFLESQDTMTQLHSRMQPYLDYLEKNTNELEESASETNEIDSGLEFYGDDEDDSESCNTFTTNAEANESNCKHPNGGLPVGSVQICSYDELSEWAIAEKEGPKAELAFLKDHVWRRFNLVGGRIQLLLNPSITFAILKIDVQKAMNGFSVECLEKMDSVELQSYTPSIMFSLLPGNHFSEPFRIEFASEAIRRVAIAILTQSETDEVAEFLKKRSRLTFASSLLDSVYKDVMHAVVSKGG